MPKYSVTIKLSARLDWIIVWPVLVLRRVRYGYTFRRVRLTDGQYSIVDPEDYYRVCDMTWYAHRGYNRYYALHKRQIEGGRTERIYMHRLIMNAPANLLVDHLNGNGLDNRKANLRLATTAQNNYNRRGTNKSSRYKGVSRTGRKRPWQATISANKKQMRLGTFYSEIEAAKAYDRAAKKYFGEYAFLNFPSTKTQQRRFGAGLAAGIIFLCRTG